VLFGVQIMITVQNLTKRYGKIIALNTVSLTFSDGKAIAIMGENGAGKSTLLKICAGLLPFEQGQVTIDTFSIVNQSLQAREQLGYLPEMPELYDRITGREFLYYIASLRKLSNAQEIIESLSKMIGIEEFIDYEVGGYSKGMKQKISLLSAIMHQPRNLLLDEPVYGLDPLASRTIQEFIKKRQGATVLATHSTQLVEHVADAVYFLMKGKVVVFDTVENLMKQHGTIENAYFYYKDGKHA